MSVDIVGWEIYRTTNLPVVGAAVNLRAATVSQPSSAGIITNQNTDSNGRYSFTGLADGDYDIDITYAGVTKSYKGLTKFNGIVQPGNFQPVTQGLVFASPTGATGRPTFRNASLSDLGSGFGANLVVATPNGSAGQVGFRNVVGADFGVASPNGVFAGPPSGGAVAPTFRSLVGGDFGALSANLVLASPPSGGAAFPTFRNIIGADFGSAVAATAFLGGPGVSVGAPIFRGLGYNDLPVIHQILSQLGVASGSTSSATGATLIPDMSIPMTPVAGSDVLLFGWCSFSHDTMGQQIRWYVSRDGNDIIVGTPHTQGVANYQWMTFFMYRYSAETSVPHTYQLKFSLTGGTITFVNTYRGIFLVEIRR